MDPYLMYIGVVALLLLGAGGFAVYWERRPKKPSRQ